MDSLCHAFAVPLLDVLSMSLPRKPRRLQDLPFWVEYRISCPCSCQRPLLSWHEKKTIVRHDEKRLPSAIHLRCRWYSWWCWTEGHSPAIWRRLLLRSLFLADDVPEALGSAVLRYCLSQSEVSVETALRENVTAHVLSSKALVCPWPCLALW